MGGDVESVPHDGDAYVLVRKRRAAEPQNEGGGDSEGAAAATEQ